MATWQTMAAANNAAWCNLVASAHDARPVFAEDAWTSRTRTPPFYPDAVTLVPRLSVPALLDRIDISPGCSIKDSFASIDLAPHGFRVLFDAEWIVRAPGAVEAVAPTRRWRECLAFASELFPGVAFVGYGSGAALRNARAHGFEVAGPLRVWVRD